jgi:transposase
MGWRSGQSCSTDLRERVLATIGTGLPAALVAERLDVGSSFIDKASKRRRLTGETPARAQCNQQALKLAAHHEAIPAEVVRRPDVTLEELRSWLLETHGVEASRGSLHNTLIRLGPTPKKRAGGRRSRGGPTSPSGAPPGAPSKA